MEADVVEVLKAPDEAGRDTEGRDEVVALAGRQTVGILVSILLWMRRIGMLPGGVRQA